MIKENESHVKIINFQILTPHSGNLKMLHFDANPIRNGYLVTELPSDSFPLIMSHISTAKTDLSPRLLQELLS